MFSSPTRAEHALNQIKQLNGVLLTNKKSDHLRHDAVDEIQNAIARLAKEMSEYYDEQEMRRLKEWQDEIKEAEPVGISEALRTRLSIHNNHRGAIK